MVVSRIQKTFLALRTPDRAKGHRPLESIMFREPGRRFTIPFVASFHSSPKVAARTDSQLGARQSNPAQLVPLVLAHVSLTFDRPCPAMRLRLAPSPAKPRLPATYRQPKIGLGKWENRLMRSLIKIKILPTWPKFAGKFRPSRQAHPSGGVAQSDAARWVARARGALKLRPTQFQCAVPLLSRK